MSCRKFGHLLFRFCASNLKRPVGGKHLIVAGGFENGRFQIEGHHTHEIDLGHRTGSRNQNAVDGDGSFTLDVEDLCFCDFLLAFARLLGVLAHLTAIVARRERSLSLEQPKRQIDLGHLLKMLFVAEDTRREDLPVLEVFIRQNSVFLVKLKRKVRVV